MEWRDILAKIDMEKGLVMIMETGAFRFERFGKGSPVPDLGSLDPSRVLDMRIFDRDQEWHLFRDRPGVPFHVRHADDRPGLAEEDFFDEDQYLDIDTDKSAEHFQKDRRVRATGGGWYRLPYGEMEDARIKVRSYVSYDDFGQAFIRDFRLVMEEEG